jgi:hypothetical protein
MPSRKMDDLIASVDFVSPPRLQGIAALAARSGEPLTAMRLLQALVVRCARDATALMHVCTALHARNDFCTLYFRLHCCPHINDVFALFACVQRAYGTRVFSNMTFRGMSNCVCVVTLYRVCVFHVVAGDVNVVRASVTHEVNVHDDDDLPSRIRVYVKQMQALPLPLGAEAAELLLPVFSIQALPVSNTVLDRAGALKELHEVLFPLHPPHTVPLPP